MLINNQKAGTRNKSLRFAVAVIAVLLLCCAAFVCAASAAITINNADDWMNMVAGKTITDDIILGADIDLSGKENPMITEFSGTFDGQDHTISNVVIQGSSAKIGLIGIYSGNCIKNLTLREISVTSSTNTVGGLVGFISGGKSHSFENICVESGTISTSLNVGGLVGYGTGGIITFVNCIVRSDCHISGSNSGGLLGRAQAVCSATDCKIESCTISGNPAGGLCGNGDTGSFSAKNCAVNSCTISGNPAGGLVGIAVNQNSVERCTVEACSISDNGAGIAGGLFGSVKKETPVNSCTVSSCTVKSSTISGNTAGGLVGATTHGSSKVELKNSNVESCVVQSTSGYAGGCLGKNEYSGTNSRIIDTCTVKNCAIYSTAGTTNNDCGGIIGGNAEIDTPTAFPSVSGCTVEHCTIAAGGSNNAGGIAGNFPIEGIITKNKVISTCIVSKNGKAAGICPVDTTAAV